MLARSVKYGFKVVIILFAVSGLEGGFTDSIDLHIFIWEINRCSVIDCSKNIALILPLIIGVLKTLISV